MGGILTAMVDLFALSVDLSVATGISVESILTGEALAALEAEVSSVMTIQGISGLEALAQLGWTAEQFSQMSYLAATYASAVGYGVMFQTVTGLSALVSVGIRLGMDVSNSNRAAVLAELERSFGEVVNTLHLNLSHQINPAEWCASLHENFPDSLRHLDVVLRHRLGEILERGRWVNQHTFTTDPAHESGDVIQMFEPPGGAFQRCAPDWLINLLLRLDGAEEATPFGCNLPSLSLF
ncbi:minor capsid protein VP2 [Miniopterus schreibersi polyomavirus 4]|nr:minor capsid protein VP2 [Miniopterus schreibersi polyomavirus 4]